ncbi:damage-control phosphatase ARMT1 family protein [Streptomyces sp. TP-A0874]|uniref:damage-control phosphatase ARMT1 family protein n=1 Tax=Streptomyces sp. TP-A0874 TaxID=549819 RepID=UPI0008539B50|nr:damage-control phosphatase ARMT1 family protein [Streptomyces sp. TP-A0874]
MDGGEGIRNGGGAPVIVSNDPSAFPWSVWHHRHPPLVRRIEERFPYGPEHRAALEQLLDETLNGRIEPLPSSARGAGLWNGRWDRGHYGERWADAPFLWAESYFYRRLQEATGYFAADGPWRGIDFFAPAKRAELSGDAVGGELAVLDSLCARPADARTDALLSGSVWGNRADLGFQITAGDGDGPSQRQTEQNLIADDRTELRALLTETGQQRGRLVFVADNAGRELLWDLVLIDQLLTSGQAADVLLHLKPHPYYVSDATPEDLLDCLRRLRGESGAAGEAGGRLWRALAEGRLVPRAHPFSCAPLPYSEMPDDLRADFGSASLTLMKGDLNYRRLVGDRLWPATTPFSRATAYFPGPVAALRTLKSEVVTGLGGTLLEELEATGEDWRTSGSYALVQVRF